MADILLGCVITIFGCSFNKFDGSDILSDLKVMYYQFDNIVKKYQFDYMHYLLYFHLIEILYKNDHN